MIFHLSKKPWKPWIIQQYANSRSMALWGDGCHKKNPIRFMYASSPTCLWISMIPEPRILELSTGQGFYVSFSVWPLTYWAKKQSPTYKKRLMFLGKCIMALLSGKHFIFPCPCDLNLWPSDPKKFTLPLLIMTKLPIKFYDSYTKLSWVIMRTTFYGSICCDLDLWPKKQ